jgi:hypothetical protein
MRKTNRVTSTDFGNNVSHHLKHLASISIFSKAEIDGELTGSAKSLFRTGYFGKHRPPFILSRIQAALYGLRCPQ